jgi:hypothetical protein
VVNLFTCIQVKISEGVPETFNEDLRGFPTGGCWDSRTDGYRLCWELKYCSLSREILSESLVNHGTEDSK